VIEQVLLHGERAHAVAEQDQRNTRVLGPDPRGQQPDVVDEPTPPSLAEVAQVAAVGARAMAAVILRVDDVAGASEGLGHMGVALRVLTHSVRDLDRGPRLARRIPAIGSNLRPVRRRVPEASRWHGWVLSR
jgi:hypothetical protein